MAHEFNTELVAQEEWGWLLALDLFFGGMGGGLFLLVLNFHLPPAVAAASIVFVALGAAVLMVELGHPLRAWRALCRPFSSWISRGVFCVAVFIVSAVLYSAAGFEAFSWLAPDGETTRRAIGVLAAVSALLVTVYPGFVLAASPSIPFWNSPLLPVVFACHSLMAASGFLFLIAPWGWNGGKIEAISFLSVVLIALNLVIGAMYLASCKNSGLASREAVRRLSQGPLGWVFKLGVVFLGMIGPLLIVLWMPAMLALAGLFMLIGGLLFRYCVLRAGVYVPFPLT